MPKQTNGVHNACQVLLSKLHTNSLLSTLNSRVRNENTHGTASARDNGGDSFVMSNRTPTRIFVKVEHDDDHDMKASCDGKFSAAVA
jgi:hypothetical protein